MDRLQFVQENHKRQPQTNDGTTGKKHWSGSLSILGAQERGWKQRGPKDLDIKEYVRREHMKHLLQLRPRIGNYGAFIDAVQPFLLGITGAAFRDCLSVDTVVGTIDNSTSSATGNCAIPFLDSACTQLNMQRRMRLDISSMIRQTLYPKLIYHSSAKNFPNVVG